MCSPRQSHSSSEIIQRKFGIRLWYFIKIIQYVLAGVCILLLVVNENLLIVHDDFTPAHHDHEANNSSDKKNASAIYSALVELHLGDSGLLRVKRDNDRSSHLKLPLSYLLILYPCCTTVLIFFTMELLAQLFKDPLNKISNLVIITLCILLSIAIFSESLLCAIDTAHVNMILVAVLSAALIFLVIIDFVLLVISSQ